MIKIRGLALLLCLGLASAQAALNTDGLPANPAAIIALDFQAFRATKIGQAAVKFAGTKKNNAAMSALLREKLGLDLDKDIHDVLIGIYSGPDGKVSEKNASGVVLLRGKFDPARLNATAEKTGVLQKQIGKYQAWEANDFAEKIFAQKPKGERNEAYLIALSTDTLVLLSADLLEKALPSLEQKTPCPQALPAAIRAKFDTAASGWFFIWADVTQKQGSANEATELTGVISENTADLQLAVLLKFVTKENAEKNRKLLKGLQAIAAITLTQDDGKSAEEKEMIQTLGEIIQKLIINGQDDTLTLNLDYPADKLAQALIAAFEKAQRDAVSPAGLSAGK